MIGTLGILGYNGATLKYGMIKRVSKIATVLTVVGISLLAGLWAIDSVMRRNWEETG